MVTKNKPISRAKTNNLTPQQRKLPQYLSLGGALFPCRKCIINDQTSKAPLEENNLERRYSPELLQEYLDDGHAIGWSPGVKYVIMDVDVATPERPEKHGKQSLQKLKADTGLDLSEVPYVSSPTGGRHYYFRRPEGIKLRKIIREYPDIEFISGRNYVLTAGSPHWQGGTYELCEDADAFGLEPPDLPDGLLKVLEKTANAAQHRTISDEHLAELLSHIDPNDYAGYDEWLGLAMASHSATGGSGFHEFHQWCMDGDAYSSEARVEQQWESFDAEEEGGVTVASLIKAVEGSTELMEPAERVAAEATILNVKAAIEFGDTDTEALIREQFSDDEVEELPERIEPIDVKYDSADPSIAQAYVARRLHHVKELFKQERRLVVIYERQPLRDEDKTAHYIVARTATREDLDSLLQKQFKFFRTKENDEGNIVNQYLAVPDKIVKNIHGHVNWPTVPELTSIVNGPQLLPGGRILQDAGYDEGSGFLYRPLAKYPRVPDEVSRDEARAAAEKLLDIVCDFPFINETHSSAWLAGLLTMLARPAIAGPVPLFVVDGNDKGTGKSLLVSCATIVGAGVPANARATPKDDEEMRKQITSSLMNSETVVCWDNVGNDRTFGFPSLDALLTSREWSDRLLGGNKIGRYANTLSLWCTANQFKLDSSADTSRRLVFCSIDCKHVIPTSRSGFKHGDGHALQRMVTHRRPEYAVEGLKILRGFLQSGHKPDVRPMASFEAWSELIRNAILWVGLPDPCAAVEDADTVGNDVRTELLTVLDAVDEIVKQVKANSEDEVPGATATEIWTAGSLAGEQTDPVIHAAVNEILARGDSGEQYRHLTCGTVGKSLKRYLSRASGDGRRLERRRHGRDRRFRYFVTRSESAG